MNPGFGIAQIIDAVIVFTVVECIALTAYHRLTGKGVAARDFLANMLSGLCLMLALRCLAREADPICVAAFVLAAGVAHGIDIRMRWKRSRRAAVDARRMVA